MCRLVKEQQPALRPEVVPQVALVAGAAHRAADAEACSSSHPASDSGEPR